ncbi:MAG: DNA-binding protein WhiA [Chloroflexi bacterium]|nr:DNA-binding protein WhiA [Chloroflexota bacterium]
MAAGEARASTMDRPDRDLVAALRTELAAIEPARACCRAAESLGLGAPPAGRGAAPAVARLSVRLERAGDGTPSRGPFDWAAAADHCRLAYLRGRFLSRGSLSLATGRTHLEFVVSPLEAAGLAEWLAGLGLPASWRVRRGSGVVTWKGSETVLRFLRLAGASSGALQLETRLVTRALRAHLNRVLNAEGANLQRSVATASRQLAAIDTLDGSGALARLPVTDRAVAGLRREQPEATFSEIAARLGLTRSQVQRSFARLESLALQAHDGAAARR